MSRSFHPSAALPADLIHALNQAYYLHVLATDPASILPPGKSLLSLMTRALMDPSSHSASPNQLEDRVKQVVHEAFWNEATESLSSLQPSVQLPRLKLLYNDLSDALNSLLPSDHPILRDLKAPLPPTTSPLLSAIHFLNELLSVLRQRCAPLRDPTIDSLLTALESNVISGPKTYHPSDNVHTHTLAQLVIDTIKSTLRLAEDMKSDINTFLFGSLSEDQLMEVIVQEAKLRERQLVVQLWVGDNASRMDSVREVWQTWVAELQSSNTHSEVPAHGKWMLRLLQALRSHKAVSCEPPSLSSTAPLSSTPSQALNQLPPQVFLMCPDLLYIQNFLQAIVIAATLRSLTLISPGSVKSADSDFMQRIWTLLKAEIDGPGRDDYIGETRLVHLADEVVRAWRLFATRDPLSLEDEKRLREAVSRTLCSTDRVFILLQGRLISALEVYLISSLCNAQEHPVIPVAMQTGKGFAMGPGQRFRVSGNSEKSSVLNVRTSLSVLSTIKGFEDAVLRSAVKDVFEKISLSVRWVESVWGDLI